MYYLSPTPNESGAYPPPQSNSFPGAIALNDEQLSTFLEYNGFVTFSDDGSMTPNVEAWEAWKAEQPETVPVEDAPTEMEQLRADVDYLLMLEEG